MTDKYSVQLMPHLGVLRRNIDRADKVLLPPGWEKITARHTAVLECHILCEFLNLAAQSWPNRPTLANLQAAKFLYHASNDSEKANLFALRDVWSALHHGSIAHSKSIFDISDCTKILDLDMIYRSIVWLYRRELVVIALKTEVLLKAIRANDQNVLRMKAINAVKR